MQTTLLGLGIAFILALLAALVGPHFVNWNDHRAFFEAEASRLVGLNVRVTGPIKVGILPFPSMKLGGVEIGSAGEVSRLRARSLGIELGLGPLMRGEIRAVEMRLVGPEFNLGLNSLGYIDWPAMQLATETASIDRLNIEDGRAVLTDGASNSRIVLDRLWFSGEVRSLTGPFRGEGAFVTGGGIYGYRLSAGRLVDDGMRVRLTIETTEQALTIEADGMAVSDRFGPRFDGNLSFSRAAATVSASGKSSVNEPWKLSGKVKATPQSALFEQVALQYGPEERAARLTGAAEFKFGDRPRLQGALSARQIDLDKLIATPEMPRRLPLAALQNFAEMFSGALRPSVPVALVVSVDAVTLGGAHVQNVGTDLRSDGTAWHLDKLEFRAPGFTQVGLTGRIEPPARGQESRKLGFSGAASVDANDPRTLMAWLAGYTGASATIKPWQLRGDITLSGDRIAVEQLKTDFERGAIEGRLAYVWPAGNRPARLEAELSAGELDLDAVLAFGNSAFSGVGLEWPREVKLALEAGRARIAGFEARNAAARLTFDASGIAVERLALADFGNATIEASGRIVTTANPGGNITLDIDARELNGVIALADKFLTPLADPLRYLASRQKTAKLRLTAGLENRGTGSASGTLGLSGRIGALRVNLTAGATGKPEAFAVTDLRALAATDIRLEGSVEADDGSVLLPLIGLDRFGVADQRPARLRLTAIGPLSRELRFDGALTAGAIDTAGKGTIRFPADQPAAVEIDQLTGTIGGSKVQGKLAVRYGGPTRLEGAIETEALDAPALIAATMGMRTRANGAWSTEPFTLGASELAGRIELKARRAAFSPQLVARELRSVVRFGPSDVVFDEVGAELGNGRLEGRLSFVNSRDGLSANARIALRNAEVSAFLPNERRPPVTGRLALSAELEGSGLSPAAFAGSVVGTGLVTLEGAQLGGLNPRVFDAVIRAVDLGISTDAARVQDFVATALDTATLPVTRAEAALAINGGQVRLTNIVTRGVGADLAMSGNVNLSDATLDAQLRLTGTQTTGGTVRPVIAIALRGPLFEAKRTIDASMLSNWLTLRAVEQQTLKIDQMEQARREQIERERLEQARREQLEQARREAVVQPPAEASPPQSAPARSAPSTIQATPLPAPPVQQDMSPETTQTTSRVAPEISGNPSNGNGAEVASGVITGGVNAAEATPLITGKVPMPRPRPVHRAEPPPQPAPPPRRSVGNPLDLIGAQN